jgi:hypothetical protein
LIPVPQRSITFCADGKNNGLLIVTYGEMYDDGTILTSNFCDRLLAKSWCHTSMKYLCTVDLCQLASFNSINFSPTPLRSMHIQNAGGSSEVSEALSMYYMEHQLNASHFVPEKEVDYWIDYKMCDYLMTINRINIGVSVTRAIVYPFNGIFTYQHAVTLLNKKLNGLIIARNAVNLRHQFFKSILHIWCYTATAAINIKHAYNDLVQHDDDSTYSDIYVICSICQERYVYTNHPV